MINDLEAAFSYRPSINARFACARTTARRPS